MKFHQTLKNPNSMLCASHSNVILGRYYSRRTIEDIAYTLPTNLKTLLI